MEITNVRITKNSSILKDSKIRGFVSITIDNAIAVNGIRLIEGKKGMFLSFPDRKNKNGNEYVDIAFPINNEARNAITEAVLNAYKE
ncbi:SpoVG family protein [Clostridium guangxiense]|uniref:SpoVG family protein n=1 Tax=Clostridium guangxiense TaxID=1662055 RepID=UPI001E286220|nr:SpoVG family protein [Clostridium guangxiense]MCD2345097.1 SpoVG family protein [Clostridium guangxiense]